MRNIALSRAAVRRAMNMPVIAAMVAVGSGMAAIGAMPVPASAQFSDSYDFLKAVRDRDGETATRLIDEPGSGAVIINTRDSGSGEGALHIVVEGRDSQWTGFLLQKGANPNIADKKGNTPLMVATQLGFADGIAWLVKFKADVNQRNRSGETALIRAVQLRKPEMVRMLMKSGADPDITDNLAGLSARDYATRDRRNAAILALIENGGREKPKQENEGDLDFSGIEEFKLGAD